MRNFFRLPVLSMSYRSILAWLVILLAGCGAMSSAAVAQQVGQAAVIKNVVVRVQSAGSSQINVGDGIIRDETIRTGADSAARFTMSDSTNLSLGPGSTIKLDRTVFSGGEGKFRDIAIRAVSGAVRFVTGDSDKSAYRITTPVATIGVRGTVLDILAERGRTFVVLQDGQSLVCTRGPNVQCVELLQPGDSAIITATGAVFTIQKTNTPPWTFAATCQAAAGLCSPTRYANATPFGGDLSGALCGR